MSKQTIIREFWQHKTSGEKYAIERDQDGTVHASCGPLYYGDIHADRLDDYDYTAEDADWINEHTDEFRAVDETE